MNAAKEYQETYVSFGRSFNRRRYCNSIAVAIAVTIVVIAIAVEMRELGGRGTCGTCPNGVGEGATPGLGFNVRPYSHMLCEQSLIAVRVEFLLLIKDQKIKKSEN